MWQHQPAANSSHSNLFTLRATAQGHPRFLESGKNWHMQCLRMRNILDCDARRLVSTAPKPSARHKNISGLLMSACAGMSCHGLAWQADLVVKRLSSRGATRHGKHAWIQPAAEKKASTNSDLHRARRNRRKIARQILEEEVALFNCDSWCCSLSLKVS